MSIISNFFKIVPYNCENYHSNCYKLCFNKLFQVGRRSIKIYFIFYLITTIVFKYKKLMNIYHDKQQIFNELKSFLMKIFKSTLFLSVGITILRTTCCLISNLFKSYSVFWILIQALLTSTSIYFESYERTRGIAIYSFPHSFSSIFDLLEKKRLINGKILYRIILLLSVAIGFYLKNNSELDKNIEILFDLVFG